MRVQPICGKTWIFQNAVTIPFYRLNDREVILLDSGFFSRDRQALHDYFHDNHLRVSAILGSHVHQDHAGNLAYFQRNHGAEIILPETEASLLSSVDMIRFLYPTDTREQALDSFSHLLLRADRTFSREETEIKIQGETFGLLYLPGHTPDHTGVATPDDILYVGDTVVDEQTLAQIQLPSTFCWEDDFASKKRLRHEIHRGYLLAHAGYHEDLNFLIDRNLAERHQQLQSILTLLYRPMTLSEFEQVVWQNLNLSCHTVMGIIKFRRNLRCALEYLLSIGAVQLLFQDGLTLYQQT